MLVGEQSVWLYRKLFLNCMGCKDIIIVSRNSLYNVVTYYCSYVFIEHRRPTLRDLYKYVVPKCAHKWRYLGALLNFDQAQLDIIFSNFRNDSEECCRSLLSRWLEKTTDASWNQLFLAIDDVVPLKLTKVTYPGMIKSAII